MSTSGKAAGGPPTGPAGGDIAGTGTSTYPNPTLTALGAATGPIGSATVVPIVTIDTKGRVTALTSATITGNAVSVATATLNGAALAALFSAPTTLVAAPGANRALVVLGVEYEFVAGVTSYFATASGIYYGPTALAGGTINADAALLNALGFDTPVAQVLVQNALLEKKIATATAVNKAIVVGMPTANPDRAGAIVTTTLDNGGAGYVIGDTGTIDSPEYGAVAAYVVDTVGALGVVLTYHLTSAGTGYTTVGNPRETSVGGAQPGIGTGLQLNVTAIPAADGTLYVTAYYATITTH